MTVLLPSLDCPNILGGTGEKKQKKKQKKKRKVGEWLMQYQVKLCKECGEPISDNVHNTLGSHNALQFCPECGKKRQQEQKNAWARKHRAEQRNKKQEEKWAEQETVIEGNKLYGEKHRELQQQREINALKDKEIKILHDVIANLRAKLG